MDTRIPPLEWALLQSFAAVGAHGSLSAAARATGASQPTLSRHISTLEQRLGERLFDRATSGVELTAVGLGLLHHAQKMADAAAHISIAADGLTESLAGSVRITASQIVATLILPNILTDFRALEPEIDLEIVASDQTDNLLLREADIAVRMYQPTQQDVFTKKVGDLKMGMYAAKYYLDRHGRPETLMSILDHDVIGYDRSTQIIDGFKQAGVEVDRDFFAFRCDDQVVCWQMVTAGYGIGFNQIQIGDGDPRVERLQAAGSVGQLPVWLTAHVELKTNPRVRRVFDFLSERLSIACA